MLRGLHRDMRTIILIQQRKLFIKIRTKESRASNRGGVAACVGKATKCAFWDWLCYRRGYGQ